MFSVRYGSPLCSHVFPLIRLLNGYENTLSLEGAYVRPTSCFPSRRHRRFAHSPIRRFVSSPDVNFFRNRHRGEASMNRRTALTANLVPGASAESANSVPA
jgi:hypothetical protein